MNSVSTGGNTITTMKLCSRRRVVVITLTVLPIFILMTVILPRLTVQSNFGPITSELDRSPSRELLNINTQNSQQVISNTPEYSFTTQDLFRQYAFSIEGPHDVLVFLHIQKTGGTFFGKNVVKNLEQSQPELCNKDNGILNCPAVSSDGERNWLFSRYSVGWKCGLHADYTELHECLNAGAMDKLEKPRTRRFLYFTVVRDPIVRYLSEWLHVQRGASWLGATLRCNGQQPTLKDLPFCFPGDSWENVTLPEFMDCHYNLAHNRQTRMIANLSLVGCYENDPMGDQHNRQIILQSAKDNLRQMPYFAIMKYPDQSQLLFEWTFNLKFKDPFTSQHAKKHHTPEIYDALNQQYKDRLHKLNDLDIELYNFAEQLFLQRYNFAKEFNEKIKSATKG